jgi:putative DNA primase/helicase
MNYNFNPEQIARKCGNTSKSNGGWICSCPVSSHGKGRGDKHPSLSTAEDRGKLLLKCHAGCSFEEILKALMDMGLITDSSNDRYRASNSTIAKTGSEVVVELAPQSMPIKSISIWNNSKDATDTLVENYLYSRNLTITPPETIRFHPNLKYFEQDSHGVWHESWHPAMIAKIQRYPNDSCIGVHRTYLKPDGSGKAEVLKPKKMLGSCLGGAVRFQGESLECIALSEGIENGLTYWQENPYITAWACLSTSGMKSIVLPPPHITPEIIIIADHDPAGFAAAKELAYRLTREKRKVYIIAPRPVGADMNAILGRSL